MVDLFRLFQETPVLIAEFPVGLSREHNESIGFEQSVPGIPMRDGFGSVLGSVRGLHKSQGTS